MKRSPIIVLLILGIIVVGTGTTYLWLVNKSSVFKSDGSSNTFSQALLKQIKGNPPEVPKQASKLDGTLVPLDKVSRHPLGVMIENHPDARPQYGLSSASVVYEAIVEGGITRFLAIFAPYDATKVGPIRSARTYYADWCDEFDCFYAHVGGNYDALTEKIPGDKIKDLDEFANGSAYHRKPHDNVATEHTMYSSSTKLYDLTASKKWSTPVRDTYNIYSFFDNPSTPPVPTVSSIKIAFSSAPYDVAYTYNPVTNYYTRDLAGKPHIDAENKQQIAPRNIIIQNVDRTSVLTKINEQGFAMSTVGSGKATIYQGGQKIVGTWKKKDAFSRTEFYDASGKLIDLYRGATWIEAVNPGASVTDNEGAAASSTTSTSATSATSTK